MINKSILKNYIKLKKKKKKKKPYPTFGAHVTKLVPIKCVNLIVKSSP